MEIKITLPDGSVKEVEKGSTPIDIARGISEGLARNVLSALVNDKQVEPNEPINEDSTLQLLTWNDDLGKHAFWHSSAHLLAQAITQFYPNAKLTIGPAVKTGFYYDVDFGEDTLTDADLPKLEKRILENARKKAEFHKYAVPKEKALETYKDNVYKTELIENLEDGEITFCEHDDFTDLCRGGHLPNTGFVKAVKITSIAGAYWRGDEKNKQLTRVYGVTFPKKKELDEYLEKLELARQRDHRKLGKELELFTFSQNVGQGLPLWLPKGAELRARLETFLKKVQKEAGYEMVISPHIGAKELYVTSGHYAKYGEDSFQPIHTPDENEEFLLKPMNCPHHCEIYKAKPHSYRDLPIRYAEFGTVYRYEQSGELHGLTRVRGFTQDDAHIFCTPDQVKEEFKKVIDIVFYIFKVLKFENYTAQVSLRDPETPEKYIGSDENWEKAERAIQEAVAEKGLKTTVELGEAAFYGPKLDFMVEDAIGREWQLGTIQVDYNLPERFELEYIGADDNKHRPVMIHRAPFGSMERFVAVLIEHTAGSFPLWLTSEQFAILPVSEKYNEYSEKVLKVLKNYDIRGFVDDRNEKVGKKIRDAEVQKTPFMLILGDKEIESNTISVRQRGEGDLGSMTIEQFAGLINQLVEEELSNNDEIA